MELRRQGDVLIVSGSPLPEAGFTLKVPEGAPKKNNVVANGEVTGHRHVINGDAVESYGVLGGEQFAVLSEDGVLIHDEHHAHELPSGVSEIITQRELDLLGQVRNVMD
jgi:hypothetical protein